MKFPIKHLEMHVIHDCNLSCPYCHHYCNYGYKGTIPFAEGGEWLRTWSKRLEPEIFRLLGGEPLLHPNLGEYIECGAECFPNAKRDVVTNGLLARRLEPLFPLLVETDTAVTVSLHPLADKRHEIAINDALVLLHQWRERGLKLNILRIDGRWEKYYHGEDQEITPYQDGNPERSWRNCPWHKDCLTLHQGNLYECLHIAYLPLIVDKLVHRRLWEPYLKYEPLSPDASDEALRRFLENDDHWYCGICSTTGPQVVVREGKYPDDIIGRLSSKMDLTTREGRKWLREAARQCWRDGRKWQAIGHYGSYLCAKIFLRHQ